MSKMQHGRQIAGVLFDFDGTLTRPGAIDFAAIKTAIGCPERAPILEYMETLDAPARRAAWEVLERFEAAAAAAAQPNEGAEDLIAFLRARRLPLGILTRNSRVSVMTALAKFSGVSPADFAAIITREDVLCPKPHPEGVHLAAQRMQTPVNSLAVVGDYRYDIEAGRAAGAVTFFLRNGSYADPLPEPAADFYLHSLADFRAWLEKPAAMPWP